MIYVYSRHIETGKESFVSTYSSWKDALDKIYGLYKMDYNSTMRGQFYYFAKER